MLSNVEIKFLDKKVTLDYVLLRFTRLLVFQGKSVNWGLFYFSFAGKTQLKKECNKNRRNFLYISSIIKEIFLELSASCLINILKVTLNITNFY